MKINLPSSYKSPNILGEGPANPVVSVCITTYNHGLFIKQCIESILAQETDFEFELILGEDHSTDGTRDICMDYAAQYPSRIRLVLHHRENVKTIMGSQTGRFNFLFNLAQARGKYIALTDGDDFWNDPTKLQRQFEILESDSTYSLCCHPVNILREDVLDENRDFPYPPGRYTAKDLAERNFIHTTTCMFRRPESLPDWLWHTYMADYPLHMLNTSRGDIYLLEERMATYRVHGGGNWSNQSGRKHDTALLHALITMRPHLEPEVGEVIDRQMDDLMRNLAAKDMVHVRDMTGHTLSEKATFSALFKAITNKVFGKLRV